MKSRLGLDFGMTTSILSYMKENELKRFSYGGETDGTPYVPTAVLYADDDIHIGVPAIELESDKAPTEQHFKMRLSKPQDKTGMRSAEDLTADFIGELIKGTCPRREMKFPGTLNDLAFIPFLRAEVEKLVIAIPNTWEEVNLSPGRRRLQLAIREQLQLPVTDFVLEPVAAAAYFSFKYKKENEKFFKGNLLVCDMGGGTFDVTLCRVGVEQVKPIAKAGSGDIDGFGIAGNHFDRILIKNCFGELGGAELVALMLDLDRQKKNKSKQLDQVLKGKKSEFSTIYLLSHDDRNVNIKLADLEKAFFDIDQSIGEVLRAVMTEAEKQNESIDRAVLVGGFSKFPLVQRSVRKFFEANGFEANNLLDLTTLNADEMAYAISYGACMIANGIIQTSPKYAHTINLNITGGTGEDLNVALIKGGVSLDKLAESKFISDENGRKLPFSIGRPELEIEFTVELNGDGKILKKRDKLRLPDNIEYAGERLFVGGRVDNWANPFLVLQFERADEIIEHSLEKIITE